LKPWSKRWIGTAWIKRWQIGFNNFD
jgi:hypothetical protein